MIALAGYLATAGSWLAAHAERRPPRSEMRWGRGSDAVGLFHNLTAEEERARVEDIRRWQRLKTAAGYGSISWPVEHGGAGLPRQYEAAFTTLERGFVTPPAHEAMTISLNIEAPTILALGNDEQRRRHVGPLRRTDEICCQLFSEPVAGSDLGAIAARAERDGDTWVINGQKVWTSGAHLADIGYLVARSDPGAPRQTALTAFLLDMDAPGVEVRPLRQMTGGVSFNEVFLTDVRLPDTQRLGDVGRGWHAMMTTLGYERAAGSSGGNDLVGRLLLLARHLGRNSDPVVRQRLARGVQRQPRPHAHGTTSLGQPARRRRPRCRGLDRQARRQHTAHRPRGDRHRPRRTSRHRGQRRVGHLRVDRTAHRRARPAHRRRHGRDPTQHHRRTRAGLPREPR